jgi:hypothetical protein
MSFNPHPAPHSTPGTPGTPGTAQHITFVVRHLWTTDVESIDVPDYTGGFYNADGIQYVDPILYEVIDIIRR